MNLAQPIEVGTVVVATRHADICDIGEPGVGDGGYALVGRPDCSFLLRSSRYDGFSPDEVETFLHVIGTVCRVVHGYRFKNVLRLKRDI